MDTPTQTPPAPPVPPSDPAATPPTPEPAVPVQAAATPAPEPPAEPAEPAEPEGKDAAQELAEMRERLAKLEAQDAERAQAHEQTQAELSKLRAEAREAALKGARVRPEALEYVPATLDPTTPDGKRALEELRQSKPFLFEDDRPVAPALPARSEFEGKPGWKWLQDQMDGYEAQLASLDRLETRKVH